MHVGKLLANTTMSSCAKWKIWAFSTLADEPKAIIEMFFRDIVANDTTRSSIPAVRIPEKWIREVLGVSAGATWGSE